MTTMMTKFSRLVEICKMKIDPQLKAAVNRAARLEDLNATQWRKRAYIAALDAGHPDWRDWSYADSDTVD